MKVYSKIETNWTESMPNHKCNAQNFDDCSTVTGICYTLILVFASFSFSSWVFFSFIVGIVVVRILASSTTACSIFSLASTFTSRPLSYLIALACYLLIAWHLEELLIDLLLFLMLLFVAYSEPWSCLIITAFKSFITSVVTTMCLNLKLNEQSIFSIIFTSLIFSQFLFSRFETARAIEK